jgi:hypothetical protein
METDGESGRSGGSPSIPSENSSRTAIILRRRHHPECANRFAIRLQTKCNLAEDLRPNRPGGANTMQLVSPHAESIGAESIGAESTGAVSPQRVAESLTIGLGRPQRPNPNEPPRRDGLAGNPMGNANRTRRKLPNAAEAAKRGGSCQPREHQKIGGQVRCDQGRCDQSRCDQGCRIALDPDEN